MSEICSLDTRRKLVRRSELNGLDEVEVTDDRRTLLARFFHDAPEELSAANLRISGGVAVRDIGIIDVRPVTFDDPDVPRQVEVALDRSGDASTYRLHVAGLDGIDQRYADAPFLFFPDADDGMDCADTVAEVPATAPPPPLDYLAKDYTGFRQVTLDRLAMTLPEWHERHIPDFGIMLVELLAYVADRLSYYQDAVATEAYLGTARRRISVRRHVRLIDYPMHEGCNARALVQIDPAMKLPPDPASLIFLLSDTGESVQFRPIPTANYPVPLGQARTTMEVYCWGDGDCELPKGAISATLVDLAPGEDAPTLQPGDFLILEVLTAGLDSAPDPDPRRRHPVRLTEVTRLNDALLDKALLRVAWSPEDALPTAFPLSSPGGGPVTVARGNLMLVDHGRRVVEGNWVSGKPIKPMIGPGRRRSITLSVPGLAFADPVVAGDSAQRILAGRDPRRSMPQIERLQSWPKRDPAQDVTARANEPPAIEWIIKSDLIDSGQDDPHAVVEIDDDDTAILRFGDGVCGRDPWDQEFEIAYRVGNGLGGNVGADRITRLRHTDPRTAEQNTFLPVRNPLPASGGTAPEDVERVKLLAPHAFRDTQMRAVTTDDYAALAVRLEPAVQRAAGTLVPSGGRQVARIAIDPFGGDAPDKALERRVAAALEPYRRVGHDVMVVRGNYVPLLLVLRVELRDGYLQAHLRAALRAAMGTGVLTDGRLAAFHPDNLTFGTPIFGSRVVTIAQAMEGVRAVAIVELARLFDRERGEYAHGVLRMAWNEIPQLDNDPLRPDQGRLILQLVGGLA